MPSRYQIIRPLGRGGMGDVYLARDGDLDRLVALKVPRFPAGDAEAAERFAREAKAAATIDHPNVCRVYDVGRIDGQPYFTMAYVEGPTLAAVLKDGPLAPRLAAAVARDVARALAEAHRLGVVHRDLKPANILLSNAECGVRSAELKRHSALRTPHSALVPVLTDFGLARRDVPAESRLTAEGVIAGTPLYMSPEQVAGDRAGPASDVYSLGVVLYEMATGRTPFAGSRMEIFSQTLTADPPAPSTLRLELGSQFDAIVLKALAKRPEDRYAGMAEFADAMDEWLSDTGVGRSGRRRPLLLAAGAIMLVLLAAVLVRQFWGTPKVPGQPRLVVEAALPATSPQGLGIVFAPDGRQVYTATTNATYLTVHRWEAATGQPAAGEVHKSLHAWAAFASNGRWFLVGGGLSPELRRTETAELVLEPPTGKNTTSGALSADGRWVIVGMPPSIQDEKHRARVYDKDSAAVVGQYDGHKETIQCVAVSADGRWAFSASADRFAGWEVGGTRRPLEGGVNGVTCVISLPNSDRFLTGSKSGVITAYDLAAEPGPRLFDSRHTDTVTCLAASADGQFVVSGSADHSIRVWDANGTERWNLDGRAAVTAVAVSPDGRRVAACGSDRTWRVWELPE